MAINSLGNQTLKSKEALSIKKLYYIVSIAGEFGFILPEYQIKFDTIDQARSFSFKKERKTRITEYKTEVSQNKEHFKISIKQVGPIGFPSRADKEDLSTLNVKAVSHGLR